MIEKEFKDIRVIPALNITTECPVVGRRLERDKIVDIFQLNKLSTEVVVGHLDLVWMETAYGVTPIYFDFFDHTPTNTADLNTLCNRRKLKHAMMG